MTTTEPSPAATARPSLRLARKRFLSGGPLPGGVPEEVVAAWRRARFFGVPHDLKEPAVAPSRPVDSALLGAARPVLDRIVPALDTDRSLLVLTDERLRVLWSAGGVPGLDPCPVLSEQEVGNNSAALALRTRRRAEVHGPEHYLDRWQEVSAVSVPVFDPEGGRVVGTLTVASRLCAVRSPHPQAALAEAAATAVDTELRARAGRVERVLLDAYLRAGQDRAVAALDGRNRLISAAAQRLLTPEVLAALERTAVSARHADGTDPAASPEAAVVSGPVELPEGAGCTARITPVRLDGTVVGVVAVLEPLDAAPLPVPGSPAPSVALTGSSVPWRHVVARAAELARSRRPLLLIGERGAGKSALARELLGPGPVQEADAARDAGLAQALPTPWPADRPLLLRHAERLAQPGVAALNSLLDTHPDTRLLVTYTPGAPVGPCLQRLLDKLSARSVTLPPLRERTEDIRELLPALAPRPAPGQPPLTWTLDALRALERYPWPGNVTELAHVVRALAEHRRMSGPVRRAELPDAVREGPAVRPLSPMEHAERAAILEALRLHGGNKARAAAALGIGRATLYRKLRGYRV
ncbi:transcriptional regulator of acetoin/glycerol metabolism [Streptomyces africanus]|uniref:Transcriptional regulator of acetoin/glycerol metabolism n=1 Tax=Streptomyces africanus TaxID=231024 RepID=A0ABU0QZ10_9ACTN|nr:helix-turn-helix domain-containing protein [Streptomyces africanus]MDQ0752612.1 transcriptional regulator of acetoin/glycerol metabolism [Streptomyces africanus]